MCIFNKWSKWEVYKTNQIYFKINMNPILGWESIPYRVYCDVMVKTNKRNGMKKYKKVEK